jgi:hypothetical protein
MMRVASAHGHEAAARGGPRQARGATPAAGDRREQLESQQVQLVGQAEQAPSPEPHDHGVNVGDDDPAAGVMDRGSGAGQG